MSANTTRMFVGYVLGKKTGGDGVYPVGQQVLIPIMSSRPRDPENNSYVPVVNKSAFTSVKILGRRTPSLGFTTMLKTSWLTGAILRSWIAAFDSNNDGDQWSWLLNDGTQLKTWSNRVFDGCRGVTLSLAQSASGSGIGLDVNFMAQSAQGTATFNTGGLNPDAGNMIDSSQCDFGDLFTLGGVGGAGSTADLVRGWRLNLLRGGSYDMFFNGTLYPAGTSSGMFGGTYQLEQSPLYNVSPNTATVIRLGPSGSPLATLNLALSHDEDVLDIEAGLGDIFRTFTLMNAATGGAPCVFQ